MWINAQVFMELVQRIERMDAEHKTEVRQLKERIEALEKRPIAVSSKDDADESSKEMMKLFTEMTHGTKDELSGRVVYTDGRD